MKIVAFLPAKGNSERIESKNKKVLCGTPLYLHTLEKLMECNFIDEVYLDTESDEIIAMSEYTGCKVLKRDPALANNKTDGHKLFYNEAKKVDADIYIQILGTSPFIKKNTIKRGIDILLNNEKYDSVILVKKEKQYLWKENNPSYDKHNIPNSFDLEDTIIESMGLYITRKNVALDKKMRFGDSVFLLSADAIEHIDVNYEDEFELAEYIMSGLKQKEIQNFKLLSTYINSAMISDVLDKFNIEGVLYGLKPNSDKYKIFGRAKTLKIRELKEGEDYKGIYNALETYDFITNNDIIIVENECSEYAYFGDLNSTLAIRSGASGAIISGNTRDYQNVLNRNFPVFARGYNCKDVRGRATVESMNRKICINGVKIRNNDLIFADLEGTVIIPREAVDVVLEALYEIIEKENNVTKEILKGTISKDILKTIGEF